MSLWSRSLAVRISWLWAGGFLVLLSVMGLTRVAERPTRDALAADTFYVVARWHFVVGFGAVFAAFGVIYALMELARRGRWRRPLGLIHFGLTFIGASIVLAPAAILAASPEGLAMAPETAFDLFSTLSSIGYLFALAGCVIFLVVIADAFRREPDPR